jgi:hypothetical protein
MLSCRKPDRGPLCVPSLENAPLIANKRHLFVYYEKRGKRNFSIIKKIALNNSITVVVDTSDHYRVIYYHN